MQADNRLIIWLVGMLVLGVGILLGVIITRRTRKKETHILELEEQLSQSREELAEYRVQVDDYLIKTSELVDQLTASYRAVYLHLADGARSLSGRDYEAAHLKLTGSDLFDHQPTDLELESDDTLTPAEEELVGGGADDEVEAVLPEIVTEEAGEDKEVFVEEPVAAEFPEVEEPEQVAMGKTEQDTIDVDVRDEKEKT